MLLLRNLRVHAVVRPQRLFQHFRRDAREVLLQQQLVELLLNDGGDDGHGRGRLFCVARLRTRACRRSNHRRHRALNDVARGVARLRAFRVDRQRRGERAVFAVVILRGRDRRRGGNARQEIRRRRGRGSVLAGRAASDCHNITVTFAIITTITGRIGGGGEEGSGRV